MALGRKSGGGRQGTLFETGEPGAVLGVGDCLHFRRESFNPSGIDGSMVLG